MADFIQLQGVFKQGYGFVPKLVMRDKSLTAISKAIYAYICSFTGKGSDAFPSQSLMCEELGISKDTLNKHLRLLKEKGYLTVQQNNENGKFSNNLYSLNIIPYHKLSDTEKTETEISGYGKVDTNKNSVNKNSSFNKNTLNTGERVFDDTPNAWFHDLREQYNAYGMAEVGTAGLIEYKTLIARKQLPPHGQLMSHIMQCGQQLNAWKNGYAPGLAKYLKEKWFNTPVSELVEMERQNEAKKRKAEPKQTGKQTPDDVMQHNADVARRVIEKMEKAYGQNSEKQTYDNSINAIGYEL